jgi:uncharacterized membrane-anchored protein
MTVTEEIEHTEVDSSPHWLGFGIAGVVLAIIGIFVSFLAGFAFRGQIFWLPWIGWLAALVVAVAAANFAERHHRALWTGLPAGVVAYGAAFGTACAIAAA